MLGAEPFSRTMIEAKHYDCLCFLINLKNNSMRVEQSLPQFKWKLVSFGNQNAPARQPYQ